MKDIFTRVWEMHDKLEPDEKSSSYYQMNKSQLIDLDANLLSLNYTTGPGTIYDPDIPSFQGIKIRLTDWPDDHPLWLVTGRGGLIESRGDE